MKSNIFPLHYRKFKNDMAVVMTLFQPVKSIRIVQNFLFVREMLRVAGIPVYSIECVIGDQTQTIKEDEFNFIVHSDSFMFYKEHLYRVLEKNILEIYSKLCFFDGDLIFREENWYDIVSDLLDSNDVVHCFEKCHWLDIEYEKIIQHNTSHMSDPIKGYSGFSSAFRRKWYNDVGFLDKALIGSGDNILRRALHNEGVSYGGLCKMIFGTVYDEYRKKVVESKPKCDFAPLNIFHLYHGNANNRSKLYKYKITEPVFCKFKTIDECIHSNNDGIYEWNDDIKPKANKAMLEVFKHRRDDGL